MALLTRIEYRELAEGSLERPLVARAEEIDAAVRAIRDDVRARGDSALFDLTERFDGVRLAELRVGDDEWASACSALHPDDRDALAHAVRNIETFHRAQHTADVEVETEPGVTCRRVSRPFDRVGMYVPGGSAPLVSTLLMLAVPARVAGCRGRIVCTPPSPNGRVDRYVLAAARLCDVSAVYKVGGAQAVAAMASGTETIPRVDKIFGPGNAYVAAAKQIVASEPGGPAIDLPAGPSEVLVIADDSADASFVAADLLSQAEHDAMSQVVLVATSPRLLEHVERELESQLSALPRRDIARASLESARAVLVRDVEQAVEVSNRYAPEHLILNCSDADALVDAVLHAGSVFVGSWSAEALGDYASGANHVLPTGGSARSYAGLTLQSFAKTMTVQRVTEVGLAGLAPTVARLSRLEGLEAHARAVERRRAALAASTVSE